MKRECVDEVRRVMRQRALNVDLQPEVEDACLEDLALYCFEKTAKGEEMVCLQDHLEQLVPSQHLVFSCRKYILLFKTHSNMIYLST